jgi:hypothetical protein
MLFVPMMTLLLLTGCAGGAGVSEAEELSLTIRGTYLEMTDWQTEATVTADYGQRVYQYLLSAEGRDGETVLTLLQPDTVAGITAHLTETDSLLEYEGLVLETGTLDADGLTPVSAIPALLEAARSGYVTACALEDGQLRLDCGDPEGQLGSGTEQVLWFDPETYALLRGEISVDGVRAVVCEFSNFREK